MSWPDPGLPTWQIDTLTISQADSTDALGRRWMVAKGEAGEKGWSGSPAPRTALTDRPSGHGSFRGVSFRKYRSISLAGSVWCPTVALREQTELELASLCADGGKLYPYRRTTETYDLVTDVALEDETLVQVVTPWRLDWSCQFAAPDPRKHDYTWQQPQATLGQDTAAGLDASGAGLDAYGAGLDAGTPTRPAMAQVGNFGTAPAKPLLALYGAMPTPVIVHAESGASISYTGSTEVGETLFINCDDFAQQDVPAHSCISTLRGNVRPLLTVGTDWPVVNPGETATFQLIAPSGDPGARLVTSLRSAWW